MNFRLGLYLLLFLLPLSSLATSTIVVSGRYEYRTDPESREMLGNLVCFFPSEESAKQLPRRVSDRRLVWFCFRNEKRSKSLLAIPKQSTPASCGLEGDAKVTITDYHVYLGEGDGFDTATLKSVGSLGTSKVLSCQ